MVTVKAKTQILLYLREILYLLGFFFNGINLIFSKKNFKRIYMNYHELMVFFWRLLANFLLT